MTKIPVDILSPKNDFVFKQLFGDAKQTAPLAAFLQAVLDLPPEEFVGLTIENPTLMRRHKRDKESILDVRVSTRSGRDVDVEIQLRFSEELRDRIQCYVARMVAEKVAAGESYKDVPQSISIVITDHILWENDKKKTRYHHRFTLYDKEADLAYPNSMAIHTLELPKLPKKDDGTGLWKWLKFIASDRSDELASLARKDSVMEKALLKLLDMSQDKATRRRAEARAKWLWDSAAIKRQALREGMEEGRAEGLAKGKAEGLAEGKAEGLAEGEAKGLAEGEAKGLAEGEAKGRAVIIRRMLLANMPHSEIASLADCPLSEIEHLSAEAKYKSPIVSEGRSPRRRGALRKRNG